MNNILFKYKVHQDTTHTSYIQYIIFERDTEVNDMGDELKLKLTHFTILKVQMLIFSKICVKRPLKNR